MPVKAVPLERAQFAWGLCVERIKDIPLRIQHPIIVHAHAYMMTLSEKLNPSIPMSNCPKRMNIAKTWGS